MNLAEQRAALITAVDSVEGVNCFEKRPKGVNPGDAWVLLSSVELLHGLVWTGNWRIQVHLPQIPQDAAIWLDNHFLPLVNAIRGPGFADIGEPALLQVDQQSTQQILEITARSE